MAQSEPEKISVEQVLRLVEELSPQEQEELRQRLGAASRVPTLEAESWLDADLGGDLERYDRSATPLGTPVQYVHKVGFIVCEELE
jgi:hypothetical protein